MPSVKELDPTASPMHFFGAEVRRARLAAGLTLAELGAIVPCDASTVSRVEAGTLGPTERFADACDETFPHMDGWFARFYQDSRKWSGPYPVWFRPWRELEAAATAFRWFELVTVPGLLQTQDYARAVLRTRISESEEAIEELVAARMERQSILDRDKPPTLWVVITEMVLRCPVGGPYVMREQVHRLAELARRPNIVVQVIPTGHGAHEGFRGPFIVADLKGSPSVAYQDTAVRGQVLEDAEEIASLMVMWDSLKAEALPRAASLELIEEVAKTHGPELHHVAEGQQE
jgi:transcriptional regulator with XRE-family HTH domain